MLLATTLADFPPFLCLYEMELDTGLSCKSPFFPYGGVVLTRIGPQGALKSHVRLYKMQRYSQDEDDSSSGSELLQLLAFHLLCRINVSV